MKKLAHISQQPRNKNYMYLHSIVHDHNMVVIKFQVAYEDKGDWVSLRQLIQKHQGLKRNRL